MITIPVRIAEAMLGSRDIDFFEIKLPSGVALKLASRFRELDTKMQDVFDRKKAIFKDHAEVDEQGTPRTIGGVAWIEGKEKEGEAFLKENAQLDKNDNVLYLGAGIRWEDDEGSKKMDALMNDKIEINMPKVKFDPKKSEMTLRQAMAFLEFLEVKEDEVS